MARNKNKKVKKAGQLDTKTTEDLLKIGAEEQEPLEINDEEESESDEDDEMDGAASDPDPDPDLELDPKVDAPVDPDPVLDPVQDPVQDVVEEVVEEETPERPPLDRHRLTELLTAGQRIAVSMRNHHPEANTWAQRVQEFRNEFGL